jgi:tRNA A-37 threonylcarbamoyl transferase component Bud32/FtsZ-binding cell division protein ZapB
MEQPPKTLVLHEWIGRTLGQYRVEALLGQGGMGVVYRGYDVKLQRPVALKCLSRELVQDADRRKRFLLEARAAARINHPAVAQVYDVDEHEGETFIAMELVEGRTVAQLIQGRELDLLGAIDVALQVACGLGKAHSFGIVHRDIKPANVMVAGDGHAKILDFGLAKLVAAGGWTTTVGGELLDQTTMTQTLAGAVKGTPAYMSPEQVKGGEVGAASDLFSLGVMLYEMATGELPFQRETPLETMHAVAFDEAPSVHTKLPDLPADLQRIIERCLQKRPQDRYPDAAQLAEALRQLRRDTEAGKSRAVSWQDRLRSRLGEVREYGPSQYMWLTAGAVGLGLAAYLLLVNVSVGTLVFVSAAGLLVYRRIRHQPRRVLEGLVRRIARIPEVQAIACHGGQITVVVDRARGQLYGRIHGLLEDANRKLYFGQPMAVTLRHDLDAAALRQFLCGGGVRYVRE